MLKLLCMIGLLSIAIAASSQSPGGVSSYLYLWTKASTGVTATANQVSAWINQATGITMTTQASKAATASVVLTTNAINFNPAVSFNGTASQNLAGRYATAPNQPALIFVVSNATAAQPANDTDPYSNGVAGAMSVSFNTSGHTNQYGVDGSGFACSFSSSSLNAVTLTRVKYASVSNASGAVSASNGIANLSNCPGSGLGTPDGTFQIGGRTFGGQPARVFKGDIGEVVYYNSNAATATQISQVESYLALKYGITLGSNSNLVNYLSSGGTTTFWTAASPYQNDVFGIGTDNGSSLTQTSSNSANTGSGNGAGQSTKGNLVLTTGTALSDQQFLMIGDDGGALTESIIAAGQAPAIAVGSTRVARTWLVQNTGSVGAVNLSFDVTGLTLSGGSTASNYRLMVNSSSSSFGAGTTTFVVPAGFTGNQLNFTGLSFTNGNVFTLITLGSSALLPVIWDGFTATRIGNQVLLDWKIATEENSDHYDIEESLNGSDFSTIGRVAAKGGTGIIDYNFTETNVSAGSHEYRIAEVDKDGTIVYSELRELKFGDGNNASLSLLENPISGDVLKLKIISPVQRAATINIISLDGKLWLRQDYTLQSGSNSINTDIRNMPAGVYIVQMKSDSQTKAVKFIKP